MLVWSVAAGAWGQGGQPRDVQLLCHRTANRDIPENTMESLQYAVLLGCNLVEIDIRRTWDGVLVLDHDGMLERLTDGAGEAETTYYDDLRRRDAGAWMGERFAGMHITTFDDALRLARERGIQLYLDIKTKGIGSDVLRSVRAEGMLARVHFGGEWDDIKAIYPEANAADSMTVWVQPGITAGQVADQKLEFQRAQPIGRKRQGARRFEPQAKPVDPRIDVQGCGQAPAKG